MSHHLIVVVHDQRSSAILLVYVYVRPFAIQISMSAVIACGFIFFALFYIASAKQAHSFWIGVTNLYPGFLAIETSSS